MERNLVLSDFNNIPGKLIDLGIFKFNPVETISNATRKTRTWTIYVAAKVDNEFVDIVPGWINGTVAVPDNVIAIYYTISGFVGGKMTRSADKVVQAGKVKRSVIQQALSEAMNDWRKQSNKASGGELTKPQLLQELDEATLKSVLKKWPTKPPLYISYKYNGTRALATLKDDEVFLYSRSLHGYDIPHICAAVEPILRANPGLILDGELYIHGVPLHLLGGATRSGEKTKFTPEEKATRDKLMYFIFDVIDPENLQVPFVDRYHRLVDIIKPTAVIQPVEQMIIPFQDGLIDKMQNLMKFVNTLGIEGLVMRIGSAGYDESNSGYHSINALKIKPTLSEEFTIMDYDSGKGKNEDTLKLVCSVPEALKDKGGEPGKTFSVMPMGTYEEKQELFRRFETIPGLFETHYKNKLITVEFAEWSSTGLPQQVRAIALRDYE